MPSLNQIAQQVAIANNKINDVNYLMWVKDIVKQQWNLLIRRSIERNGVDSQLILPLYSDMVFVDPITDLPISADGLYRTELKIPPPVRYKSDAPFLLVSDASTQEVFAYSRRWESRYRRNLPFVDTKRSYDYLNGYIYLLNPATNNGTFTSNARTQLTIQYVSSDPDLTIDRLYADRGIGWEEDFAFPYSADLVNDIIKIASSSTQEEDKK